MKVEFLEFHMAFPGESYLVNVIAMNVDCTIAGQVTFKQDDGVMEFNRLFVDRGARRQGVGRALVEYVMNAASVAKCRAVSCQVHPSNDDARRFYEALGFHHATTFDSGNRLMTRAVPKIASGHRAPDAVGALPP